MTLTLAIFVWTLTDLFHVGSIILIGIVFLIWLIITMNKRWS